jgi:hypothetical protein
MEGQIDLGCTFDLAAHRLIGPDVRATLLRPHPGSNEPGLFMLM